MVNADPLRPWRVTKQGVILALRVTARGGRDGVEGIELQADGRPVLRVRVRAAATEGAANQAVISVIAKSFGVARTDLRLLSGRVARLKQLEVTGDPTELVARLEDLVAG